MAVARPVLLFALGLFATTSSLAQLSPPPPDDPAAVETAGGRTDRNAVPDVPQIQHALDALEKCRGKGLECPPPVRTYVVHAARCMAVLPRDIQAMATCRLDMTMTDTIPDLRVRRFRDDCARFVRSPESGWTVFRDWGPPCEVPSTLVRDPHPRPERKDVEHAAVGAFTCYADGGTSDCFVQPEAAVVSWSRCRANTTGEKGEVRFICRISGTVWFSGRHYRQPFRNLCVQIKRYTDPGESPAFWGIDYVAGAPPCEAEFAARR